MATGIETAQAEAPTGPADGGLPSVDEMTAHLQQARGTQEEPAADPDEGYEDPAAEEGLEEEAAAEDEVEEPAEGDDEDEPQRRAKPSQAHRLKEKLTAREGELQELNTFAQKQADTLDEIHQENLQFRATVEDLQTDYQEQSEYVSQLEAAVTKLTDGAWRPDERDAEMRQMRRQIRSSERDQQFRELTAKQQEQAQAKTQREANTREFVGQAKDVAKRFKVDPRRLVRVALSENALDKAAMENIARDLRGTSPEAKKAKRQVQKNRKAPRSLRPNGQVRSRAQSQADPMADIEASMLGFMKDRRGQGR